MSVKNERDMMEDEFYDDDEDEDTQKDKYLTFHVGSSTYGIEIYHVIEIVGIQKITEVPDMPDHVKGVINLRGQIIPVMDVRLRFHMAQREYDDRTCVVVVQVRDTVIGLVVDTVNEVVDIPEENISPPPKLGERKNSQYIRGMGKAEDGVKILLNADKLVFGHL